MRRWTSLSSRLLTKTGGNPTPGLPTRAARLGTLHELTKLAPIAVIAETLGYSPATIERHAIGSAATYAQYIAAAHEQRNAAHEASGN